MCPLCVHEHDTDQDCSQSKAATAVSWQISCADNQLNPVVNLIRETIQIHYSSYILCRIVSFIKFSGKKNECLVNNALWYYIVCNNYQYRSYQILHPLCFYFKNITIIRSSTIIPVYMKNVQIFVNKTYHHRRL